MSKYNKERAIAEAYTWIDTPWQHCQRNKGVAVDCVQLLYACGTVAGLEIPDLGTYYRSPNGDALRKELGKLLTEVDYCTAKVSPGAIVCFRFAGIPHHVGIVVEPDWMIHASLSSRKVEKIPLDPWWDRRGVCGFC